jgi:Protein of unknown function (DUF2384)
LAKPRKGKSSAQAAGSKAVSKTAQTGTSARRGSSASVKRRTSTTSRGTSVVRDQKTSGGTGKRTDLRLVTEEDRLDRLIDELGNNRVASLLAVSRSQPSRWRSGKEGMSSENRRKLIDLDYVFGRLEQLFPPRQAEIWLNSYNAHLGGRPIDALRLKGASPVIQAIDAEAQGAFA